MGTFEWIHQPLIHLLSFIMHTFSYRKQRIASLDPARATEPAAKGPITTWICTSTMTGKGNGQASAKPIR